MNRPLRPALLPTVFRPGLAFAGALVLGLSLALSAAPAHAGEVVEKHDNGKPKLKYRVNDENQKDGRYYEYFESGKVKVRASYKDGELDGKYEEKDEKGKKVKTAEYEEGKLHGEVVYYEDGKKAREEQYAFGLLTHPRSLDELKEGLEAINGGGKKKGRGGDDGGEHQEALQRLNSYRYIVGVPHDVELKPEYTERAKLGAELLEAIGKGISHHPKNSVGWPEEKYKKAYLGCSEGNLAWSSGRMSGADAVDMWFYDSDSSNQSRVGHRRWKMNPVMKYTGFGVHGGTAVGYAWDASRTDTPDWKYIAYPARGYMPIDYFNRIPKYAKGDKAYCWHVQLNERYYGKNPKGEVTVYPLEKKGFEKGAPLKNSFFNASGAAKDFPPALIWRPAGAKITDGARYWVEITGLTPKGDAPTKIEYLVEFVDLR